MAFQILTIVPPILASFDWSNGLAAAGFIVAVLASALALRHLHAIRLVGKDIADTQKKTQENVQATELLREETLAALDLHEVVVRDKTLLTWVQDISTHFVKIKASEDDLLYALAHRDLLKSGDFMAMGAAGRITISADAFHHAEALATILLNTTKPGDEFWASSLVHADFWESANAYLRHQREKVVEGVAIKRVFVFDNCDAYHGRRAQEQMTRQHDAKISVKYDMPSPSAARDLAIVRKKDPTSGKLVPIYAMECKLGRSARIEHVELWAANELQLETVTTAWRDLEEFFENSKPFVPSPASPSEHLVSRIFPEEAGASEVATAGPSVGAESDPVDYPLNRILPKEAGAPEGATTDPATAAEPVDNA